MNKVFLSYAMVGLLLAGPAFSQDATPAADAPAADTAKPKLSPEELKAERLKKKSESIKIKWYTDESKAFKDAKKYKLPVWVLFSNPATCHVCQELDKNIINSRELKRAKGVCIGFRSTSPLPKYGCNQGMPTGALVTPEGKKICNLSYNPSLTPENYLEKMKEARDKVQSGEADK